MKCLLCKGTLEDKTAAFTVELDDSIVVVKMYLHTYALNAEKFHIVTKCLKSLKKWLMSCVIQSQKWQLPIITKDYHHVVRGHQKRFFLFN